MKRKVDLWSLSDFRVGCDESSWWSTHEDNSGKIGGKDFFCWGALVLGNLALGTPGGKAEEKFPLAVMPFVTVSMGDPEKRSGLPSVSRDLQKGTSSVEPDSDAHRTAA